MIDLIHKNSTCELLPNFPAPMYSAFGGLINNNLPVICGLPQNSIEPSCSTLGENFVLTKLLMFSGDIMWRHFQDPQVEVKRERIVHRAQLVSGDPQQSQPRRGSRHGSSGTGQPSHRASQDGKRSVPFFCV